VGSPADHVSAGIYGLLIGDALGVPYEFHRPLELPKPEHLEYRPPAGFDRAHAGVPPGTWSDDGALALCLLASLLDCGRLDPDDLGRRIVAWYDEGYVAVDGLLFDVGVTTGQAILAIRRGVPVLDAGSTSHSALGNGSLMRCLPLALWHLGTDAELVADAHAQSCLTHGHARAQVCCALYCLWARRMLAGQPDPWVGATKALRAVYPPESAHRHELEWSVRPDDPPGGRGGGYVVDCLRSARWAVEQGPYEVAVRAAIALGDDTDTTACVAGGIAGVRDGMSAIPERWLVGLRGRDIVGPLLERLATHLAG
jgi:ADP-ribosyl-[dinitrogen reductase] hydrolase